MRLEKQFDVKRDREGTMQCLVADETLIGLFPDAKTEIVERAGDRRTLRSQYTALGREGTATFHFEVRMDGGVRFEKVCDGNIWRKLVGEVSFEEKGAGTRVRIELEGKTRPLVPEFAIRGAMREQIEQMATALRSRIESA